MCHTKIVKQAWTYVCHYRALWFFGIILAITATGWGSISLYSRDNQGQETQGIGLDNQPGERFDDVLARAIQLERSRLMKSVGEVDQALQAFLSQVFQIDRQINLAAWLWSLAGLIAGAYALAKVAAYFGHVALVQMVNEQERNGKRYSIRQAIYLSWSRLTWRLMLVDLAVYVPVCSALILLSALALTPVMLWTRGNVVAGIAGTVVAAAIFLLAIVLVVVASTGLSLMKPFFYRACILEQLGVIASMRRGATLAQQHLKDITLTWLIMAGLRIAWPFLMAPIILLLAAGGIASAGLGGLSAYQVVLASAKTVSPILIAVSTGVVLLFLITGAPLLLLGGLREVFLSSMWTLTFRELTVLNPAEAVPTGKLNVCMAPAVLRQEMNARVMR